MQLSLGIISIGSFGSLALRLRSAVWESRKILNTHLDLLCRFRRLVTFRIRSVYGTLVPGYVMLAVPVSRPCLLLAFGAPYIPVALICPKLHMCSFFGM